MAKISKKKNKKFQLPDELDWTFELLDIYHDAIRNIAKDFKLDCYPNQIEIITAEQMMDAYSSVGMPLGYSHWSFGKKFIQTEQNYKRGQMGLAYEIVINSNPCIAYLMEENTLPMQALVMAHACYGHNSFFKNNYLFKTWTDASSIIDYMLFTKNFILECEEKYGAERVELIIDACHALMNYGVDRYKHPKKISIAEEKKRQKAREEYLQTQINELWKTIPSYQTEGKKEKIRFPVEPQENILHFIENNAPLLEPWEREIVRAIRKISQYFYPQRQTQVMNEGWATFWHYTILNKMYDERYVSDRFMMEVLHSHTNVIYQPPYNSPYYSGINPYALGFAIFSDLQRICTNPTQEDKHWFPDYVNTPWLETLDFAMRNFKDESFISQFLSPKVMRDLKFFSIYDNEINNFLKVSAIHDEEGYLKIRNILSSQYNLSNNEPNIQVYEVDLQGDRSLTLQYKPHQGINLADSATEVLKHLQTLWRFDVHLKQLKSDDTMKIISTCYRDPNYIYNQINNNIFDS